MNLRLAEKDAARRQGKGIVPKQRQERRFGQLGADDPKPTTTPQTNQPTPSPQTNEPVNYGFGRMIDENDQQPQNIEPTQQMPPEEAVLQGHQTPDQQTDGFSQITPSLDAQSAQEQAALMQAALQSPAAMKIKQNMDAIQVLRTMPVTDKDGRTMSALKAFAFFGAQSQRLMNARTWADLGAGIAGAAGAAIGGAINPSWNEYVKRQNEIGQLDAEMKQLTNLADLEWKRQYQSGQLQVAKQRADGYVEQINDRKARNAMQTLDEETKRTLQPIFQRGYYYEGDNPAEDAALAKLNVVMPDFDNTRKPLESGGQKMGWNVRTRQYEQQPGTVTNPDDVPVTFEVGGRQVTSTVGKYVGYLGQKENAERQAQISGARLDFDKERFAAEYKLKVQEKEREFSKDAAALARWRTEETTKINTAYGKGELDQQTRDKMLAEVNKVAPQ